MRNGLFLCWLWKYSCMEINLRLGQGSVLQSSYTFGHFFKSFNAHLTTFTRIPPSQVFVQAVNSPKAVGVSVKTADRVSKIELTVKLKAIKTI